MKPLTLRRSKIILHPDYKRVLIRPLNIVNDERAVKICARVMVLPDAEVRALLDGVLADFNERHVKIHDFLKRRYEQVRAWLPTDRKLSGERELLIGAYFTPEY